MCILLVKFATISDNILQERHSEGVILVILHTHTQMNFHIGAGAYAWMILPHDIDINAESLSLTECLAALYVQGAEAELCFLESDTHTYQLIILRERIAESNFTSSFPVLIKYLNTISYGFLDGRKNIDFDDFIASIIQSNMDIKKTKLILREAKLHEKIASPQSNNARYLRDQMGKQVLARLL